MNLKHILGGAAVAVMLVATSASARPGPGDRHGMDRHAMDHHDRGHHAMNHGRMMHHRHCTTMWRHHHRVRTCR